MIFFRSFVFIACLTCSVAWPSDSFDDLKMATSELKRKYPEVSFVSSQIADGAIDDSVRLQGRLAQWFIENEVSCYGAFFVNSCLQDIKSKRRQLLPELKEIEFAAKDFKRQSRVFSGDQKTVRDQMK